MFDQIITECRSFQLLKELLKLPPKFVSHIPMVLLKTRRKDISLPHNVPDKMGILPTSTLAVDLEFSALQMATYITKISNMQYQYTSKYGQTHNIDRPPIDLEDGT